MNNYNYYMQLILEGGNKAKSDPILKEYIKPTLDSFSRDFKKAVPGIRFEYSTLGSVGHKHQSGDIDLSLDISEFLNKEMKLIYKQIDEKQFEERFEKLKSKAKTASIGKLRSKALCQMLYEKLNSSSMKNYLVDSKASDVGSTIFFKYPQRDEKGKEIDKTVQIDLNIGNKEWLNFAYYSSPNIYSNDFKSKYGNLKGLHRTQLLVALFGAVGLTFDHTTGVKDKKTNEVIGQNPKEAITILNSKYKNLNLKENDVDNYASLMQKIRKLSKPEEEKVIKEYLTILHSAGYEDYEKPKDLQEEIKKFGFVQKIRSSRQEK